jgi:hypothetical protein
MSHPTTTTSPLTTPVNMQGSVATDPIAALNHLFTDTNDDGEPNAK